MANGGVAFTGNIYEEQERDLSLRTQFNEMRRFQRRLREQNSIIRHDTHRVPVDMGEALRIVSNGNEPTGSSDVQ